MTAHTITRGHVCTRCTRRPDHELTPDQLDTFAHALACFAYLIPRNVPASGEDWARLILQHYAPGPRVLAIVAAVRAAMS